MKEKNISFRIIKNKNNVSKIKRRKKILLIKSRRHKINKDKRKKNLKIFLILLLSFLFFSIIFKNKIFNPFYIIFEHITIFLNYSTKNSLNYELRDILPRISLDNKTVPSLEEIFNSRQLYISDSKISKKYIKYIRPINEKEEEKYHKKYSEFDTMVSPNDYLKREGQYDYELFAKLCLEEKIIDSDRIDYENKPLISIVIPSYNKEDFLIKSVRSIQNQNFKNIEIIIVNDCSTDNSSRIFKNLLETDPRIRIFHHLKNMGCWRTRIDGILYSKAKYILLFDAGDLYEDNFVLQDAYNTIEKYNLDSAKFLFRKLISYEHLDKSKILFHVGDRAKIIYGPSNIMKFNRQIFNVWGNIWIRIARANIFTKGLLLLNDLILNIYKNVWDDVWFNTIISQASFSFLVFERVGYIYLQNGLGEGSPKFNTDSNKEKGMKEWLGFLYFDYNFLPKNDTKSEIIKQLERYNNTNNEIQLRFIRSEFHILNDLLNILIEDPYVKNEKKEFLKQLLNESKMREKNKR